MKIITCASYYGSGSSALTDIVAEYNCVKDLSDFEFRFLHDIDGIRDLEYHLVDNHNRHNSGHELKRFGKLMEFNAGNFFSPRYSKFIDKELYINMVNEYIDALTDFSIHSWWFYDLYDKGVKKYYFYQIFNHLSKRAPFRFFKILKNETTLCAQPTEEKFLYETRKFISFFLQALNNENAEYLSIDQFVPSNNIDTYLRYVQEPIFVFVVDRDPRDIYFSQKYYLRESPVPVDDVKSFCQWFEYSRENGKKNRGNERILNIRFEDLIYKYFESIKKIEEFTGLESSEHKRQFDKFNPKRSVVNTKVFLNFKNKSDLYDREYIENKLGKYIYDFDAVRENMIPGNEVVENGVF